MKTDFRNFCKCIKKKKTEISQVTTFEIYLRCLPFLLIIAEMFLHLDWSPPVIGPDLERHTPLKRWVKASQLTMHIRAKTKPCRAQIQDCFEAQIWERLKKHLVLKSTVASIIPDWWPRTWWTLYLSFMIIHADGRNLQKDKHHCSTPPIWALRRSGFP